MTAPAVMPKDLRGFLEELSAMAGELEIVRRPINPAHFEVTAILEHLDRRQRYPAVLFENPLDLHGNPSPFPVLSGMFSSRERIAHAIGHPRSASKLPLSLEMARRDRERIPAQLVAGPVPVQEWVWTGSDADPARLPIVRHYEKDLSPVLTMAVVLKDPDDGFYDVSFAKTFYLGASDWLGLSIHTPHLERILAKYEERGQPCPAINVLGHHPAFFLGALAATPFGNNDYDTIGAFLGEPLRLAPSITWGERFLVPADAELIIEGVIPPGERTVVDPFGEVTRLYQAQCLRQVFQIRAISGRQGAILQDVFSGHRDHWNLSAIPKEGSIYNALNVRFGNVTAVHLPNSFCSRLAAYVSIRKTGEGQAKPVGLATLLESAFLQWVIVVDEDIDVFNEPDVLWAFATYADPDRDIDLIHNSFQLFNTAAGYTKGVIDATRPWDRAIPDRIAVPAHVMERIKPEEWLEDGAHFPGRLPGVRGTLARR